MDLGCFSEQHPETRVYHSENCYFQKRFAVYIIPEDPETFPVSR